MKQLDPIVATSGQVAFDMPGFALPALVTVNGVIISPADWSADGERLTLVAPLGEGDELGVIVFG